jgi:hypothetical protein
MCAETPTLIDSQIDVFVAIGPPSKLSLAYRELVIDFGAPNLLPTMWFLLR